MRIAENPPTRRRRRVLPWLLLLLPLGWIVFRLFEPVFTWSSGWQPLPEVDSGSIVTTSDPDWTTVARQADDILRDARDRLQTPALSAAISVDGRRVWAGAIGWADVAQARTVDLDSRFRLGSTSKAINAIAMARLIDAGKLDIEQSVRRYIPDLPETYEPVTTRLAISHTAGVPDYGLCLCFPIWEHRNRRHFDGVREALRVFENEPLLFEPGTGFRYSSYGANLAGAVLEAAAGQPYREYVDAAVFAPLRMRHSGFDVVGDDDPQRAAFYEVAEGSYKLADPVDNSIRYPSGGMLSTSSDLLALGQVLLGGDVLQDATRTALLTPQPLRDGSANPQSYALGIRVFADKALFGDTVHTRFYSHHGTAVGSTSYFAVYPEYGLVISMLMNKGQESVDAMAPEANRLVELVVAETLRRKQSS